MAFITKRLQAALQAFRQPVSVQKSWQSGGWNDLLYGGVSGLMGQNRDLTFTEQGAATAFGIIVEVQRGVMFIADSIAMLPAGIYDSRTDELILSLDARTLDMNVPGAPFIAAIRAYERRWMHNFLESIIFSDWLYGESFVLRLCNPLQGVSGVRWLNPINTEPDIQRGRIAQYRYSADDGHYLIPETDMAFRIHHRNPHDDLRGLSPVLSALPSMNIERNAERGIMSYFRNGMILGGVMMPDGENTMWSEPQIARMETKLGQMHTGIDNAFRWMIPPTKVAFQDFNQPDLEKNYAVVSAASKKIMMALGVPPELAGNPDSVSYDNADKIMRNWLLVNGKAYASKLASFINTSLLCYFEPNAAVYFKFDFSAIDQQDAALVQADYSGGLITINEARAQRGYDVDPALAGILNFGGKPIHRDILIQLANDPATFTGQPAAPSRWGSTALPAPATIPALPAPAEPVEPQKGAASLWVGLSLANNPDLIDLQKRLKAMLPDPAIKWNDPADFHVTLLYVPAVEDTQVDELVEALDGTSADTLTLKVGSLACFDNVGEHALHFRISRNTGLLELQAGLYDACEQLTLQPSGYSRPASYTPHITMGYLPDHLPRLTYHGKVNVTPNDVICSVERGGTQETVWRATGVEVEAEATTEEVETDKSVTVEHDGHTHELPVVTRDYSPAAALAELNAWRNFMNKKHARPFEFKMLRGDPADEMATLLSAGVAPAAIVKALETRFDGSRLKTLTAQFAAIYEQSWTDVDGAIKALGSIESDFTARFAPVIDSMRDGSLTSRQRAGNILRQLIRTFGARAYRQGLEDGGVTDPPDDDEQATIDRLIGEQSGYVSSLTDRVLSKDGENDTLLAGQADSWWRKSIMIFYYEGYNSAKGNAMMTFTGDDGAESCETCQKWKGKKRRLKWWTKNKLRPQVDTDSFICGGWKCSHVLEEVTGASDA